jgi:ureidoacrylate peracid hydrolase
MTGILTTLAEQTAPGRAALLVIDMQNDFCAEGGYVQREKGYDVSFAKKVAQNIATALTSARAIGMDVVWVRSEFDFKFLPPAHIAKRASEGCCLEGTWGAEFFEVAPLPDELIVTKHAFSAFRSTSLDLLLRGKGIQTLIVAGVATNVCVDSTLREGFFLGYYVVLLEDCVGSNNRVGHEGTLATVRTNFGFVVSSDVVFKVLAQRGDSGSPPN